MTDDVRNLLGGYATGTLTEDEKRVLFEAALHDDTVFAALADEQALKELLDDSAVRAQLLQAAEDPRFSVMGSLREWFEHPKSKALVATGAVLLAVIGVNQVRQTRDEANSPTVAELRRPDPSTQPASRPDSSPPPTRSQTPAQNEANSEVSPSVASRQTGPTANLAEPRKRVEREAQQQTAPVQTAAAPPPPPPPSAAPAQKAIAAAESIAVAREPGGVIGGLIGGAPSALGSGIRAARPGRGAAADATSAAAPAPVAPATASGAFQRAAGTSVTPLRYELLRRDAAGDFQAVPHDYQFTPGDVLRIRLHSPRAGAVGVSSNTSNATIAQLIPAGAWTDVPQRGGIAIAAELTKLVVAFAPTELPTTALLDTPEARAKRNATPPVSLEIPIRQTKR